MFGCLPTITEHYWPLQWNVAHFSPDTLENSLEEMGTMGTKLELLVSVLSPIYVCSQ